MGYVVMDLISQNRVIESVYILSDKRLAPEGLLSAVTGNGDGNIKKMNCLSCFCNVLQS